MHFGAARAPLFQADIVQHKSAVEISWLAPTGLTMPLISEPPFYFPLANGRYEVAPGLRPFGYDFGNGTKDKLVFQIDRHYNAYREEKLAARREDLRKYHPANREIEAETMKPIIKFILQKLINEHADYFQSKETRSETELICKLSGETLIFNSHMEIDLERSSPTAGPPYISSFDALAAQIQEDMAIWRQDAKSGREWLAAVHLCFPNHWDPADKVGKSFLEVHHPVAHFDRMTRIAPALVKSMIEGGPFVRFAWGLSTDSRLNHHPTPPENIPADIWRGRAFDRTSPVLFLRVERQTLHPFPQEGAALFTIRTYFYDCSSWRKESPQLTSLTKAIQSMTPEALAYKGLTASRNDILQWLETRP